jgi:hypothetical protein
MENFKTEVVLLSELKPHPRNYREHPEDQIEHLVHSIKENGFYRNIVIAKDGTILAGHGVKLACEKLGLKQVAVYRLNIDPNEPKALKILTGDNEIGHLGEINDRILTDMLMEINKADDLLGTGYDEPMLINLMYITRPQSEIKDFDAAAEWVGMPEYEEGEDIPKIIISFRTDQDREKILEIIGVETIQKKQGLAWSIWWPEKEMEDRGSLKFYSSNE